MIDLRLGDCFDLLAALEPESVDALVTDPPYGISFMGKHWDRPTIEQRVGKRDVSHLGRLTGGVDDEGRTIIPRTASAFATPASQAGAYDFTAKGNRAFQEWCRQWGELAFAAMKPGAHAVVFGGTRTYHRMVAGLEDAGFEIRDQLAWMFGSGFPKSLDVAKAIDARYGHLRGQRGDLLSENGSMSGPNYERTPKGEPVTAAAAAAAGWGTALKPGYEPIVLARKPLAVTVAANVMEYGTGALNVDGCRIAYVNEGDQAAAAAAAAAARLTTDQNAGRHAYGRFENGPASLGPYLESMNKGRWPPNVALDGEAAAMVDAQSGPSSSSSSMPLPRTPGDARGESHGDTDIHTVRGHDDFGGASRFFYVAKVDSTERHEGLRHPGLFAQDAPERNDHPTVKPVALMRWLCRLVTPIDGMIVDPFLGSGTTGIAAGLEGFRFLGIEREEAYMRIAEARISHWLAREVVAA